MRQELMALLKVIQGGKSLVRQEAQTPAGISPTDVRKEADRRRDAYGINVLRNRQMATGAEMPRDLHFLGLQIDLVAEYLCRLTPIPEDYRANQYWPQVMTGNS